MYPQDAIMPLPLEEADVVVGDFPIGYYPLDERSKEMKLDLKKAIVIHTFYSSNKPSMLLKQSGYAFSST